MFAGWEDTFSESCLNDDCWSDAGRLYIISVDWRHSPTGGVFVGEPSL